MNTSEGVKRWRHKTKQRIIDSMGGKCQCCGYNKCNNALELHHIDPHEKELSFGAIRGSPKSWEKIIIELRKCILLCSNCHRELHDNIINIPDNYQTFDESYADYKLMEKMEKMNKCAVCGKMKSYRYKTCSRLCSSKLSNTIEWDDDVLKDMIESNKTYDDIADHFKCSTGSVSKRLSKLGIIKKSRYYFIPKSDLKNYY